MVCDVRDKPPKIYRNYRRIIHFDRDRRSADEKINQTGDREALKRKGADTRLTYAAHSVGKKGLILQRFYHLVKFYWVITAK
jgi:hypothetical protein